MLYEILKTRCSWANQSLWNLPIHCLLVTSVFILHSNGKCWGQGEQPPSDAAELVEIFRDGDRVTLIGGTYVERMQSYNYLEALITANFPDRKLTFRNLGWSGDDVWGTARAVFGTQAEGYARLEKDLLSTDPTVIVVFYGSNESFKGESALPAFVNGLKTIADTLERTGARLVFVSPHRFEKLGGPFPDHAQQNKNIEMYSQAIESLASQRGHTSVDFRKPLGDSTVSKTDQPAIRDRLTDNGIHFNAYGYWRSAPVLAKKLGVDSGKSTWRLNVDLAQNEKSLTGGTIVSFATQKDLQQGRPFYLVAIDNVLPYTRPPATAPRGGKMTAAHDQFVVKGLPEGKYGLMIDGQPTVMASSQQWSEGVSVLRGGYIDSFEKLRTAIGEKNELFFHQHRPQNETYLFLFRKHEQGNNAVEISQFSPLILEKEKSIDRLKKPTPHTYRWLPVKEKQDGA